MKIVSLLYVKASLTPIFPTTFFYFFSANFSEEEEEEEEEEEVQLSCVETRSVVLLEPEGVTKILIFIIQKVFEYLNQTRIIWR